MIGKTLEPETHHLGPSRFLRTVYFIKSGFVSSNIFWPSLNTSQIPPPGNTLHYTLLLPMKTSCCSTKCFLPLLGCNFSCVQLSDISCQSAASSFGPVLRNAAKERPSEQNSGLLKATAGSWASQIFIKFKSSHRVSNLTASCEGCSPLLRLSGCYAFRLPQRDVSGQDRELG